MHKHTEELKGLLVFYNHELHNDVFLNKNLEIIRTRNNIHQTMTA